MTTDLVQLAIAHRKSNQASLLTCPSDVLYYAVDMLDGRSVLALTCSCRDLHASLIHDGAEYVWQRLLVQLIDEAPFSHVPRAAVLNQQPDSQFQTQCVDVTLARSWHRRYLRALDNKVLVIVHLLSSTTNSKKTPPLCMTLSRNCTFFAFKRTLRNAQLQRDKVYLEDFELMNMPSNRPLGVRGNDSLPPADLSRLFFDIHRGNNGHGGGGLPPLVEALVPRRVQLLMQRRDGGMVQRQAAWRRNLFGVEDGAEFTQTVAAANGQLQLNTQAIDNDDLDVDVDNDGALIISPHNHNHNFQAPPELVEMAELQAGKLECLYNQIMCCCARPKRLRANTGKINVNNKSDENNDTTRIMNLNGLNDKVPITENDACHQYHTCVSPDICGDLHTSADSALEALTDLLERTRSCVGYDVYKTFWPRPFHPLIHVAFHRPIHISNMPYDTTSVSSASHICADVSKSMGESNPRRTEPTDAVNIRTSLGFKRSLCALAHTSPVRIRALRLFMWHCVMCVARPRFIADVLVRSLLTTGFPMLLVRLLRMLVPLIVRAHVPSWSKSAAEYTDVDSSQRDFDAFPFWHACKFTLRASVYVVRAFLPVAAISITHESAKVISRVLVTKESKYIDVGIAWGVALATRGLERAIFARSNESIGGVTGGNEAMDIGNIGGNFSGESSGSIRVGESNASIGVDGNGSIGNVNGSIGGNNSGDFNGSIGNGNGSIRNSNRSIGNVNGSISNVNTIISNSNGSIGGNGDFNGSIGSGGGGGNDVLPAVYVNESWWFSFWRKSTILTSQYALSSLCWWLIDANCDTKMSVALPIYSYSLSLMATVASLKLRLSLSDSYYYFMYL